MKRKSLKINVNLLQFMALSNMESNSNELTVVDLVDSYNTLFKKDIILMNLLG